MTTIADIIRKQKDVPASLRPLIGDVVREHRDEYRHEELVVRHLRLLKKAMGK